MLNTNIIIVILSCVLFLAACAPQQERQKLPEYFTITQSYETHGAGSWFNKVSLTFEGERAVSGERTSSWSLAGGTFKCDQKLDVATGTWKPAMKGTRIMFTPLTQGYEETWKWEPTDELCADILPAPLTRQELEQAIAQGKIRGYKITTTYHE
jgi:hypothetical protein